jgi:hydroxymethylglutaryl-CoA lyase
MTNAETTDVTIVEVGPRDGLQNERATIPTATKIAFIDRLSDAGFNSIEATSFVHPKAVPQMADGDEVMRGIDRKPDLRYSALVPNLKGYERARGAGVDAVALFAAATESFSKANINSTIDESFERFSAVTQVAQQDGVWVRGYVSVSFDCPYSGSVDPADAIAVGRRLLDLGCDEICFADTTGKATQVQVLRLLDSLPQDMLPSTVALHFHDTNGEAIANIDVAFEAGVRIFDASAGGLGGCPFSPGAPGNVSTEKVVTFFEQRGVRTGVDVGLIREAVELLAIPAGKSRS